MNGRVGAIGAALLIAGVVLIGAGAWAGGGFGGTAMMSGYRGAIWGPGMMGGNGGTTNGAGMMGASGPAGSTSPRPGETGFVAGTATTPRVVRVLAGPGYTFTPSTIAVARGETVTFQVTSMGGLTHEFMVGPAADVAVDKDGTPEVADVAMMQTKSVTVTFDGSGPYAFACHATGHYEAGMRGTITVVG
jgi:uncharacterized cupredoxin-like copper-binding protein